ncbi:hypothetical protein CRUP_024737 [Coryphaenoides rupestris]|nr:hypothetical protein CRUP_024737 [Coryphaenoides rupestris]
MESRFASLRQRDSSTSMLRVKLSRRRSQCQKENRGKAFNSRRQLDQSSGGMDSSVLLTRDMSVIQEKSGSLPKTGENPVCLDRLKCLERWKERKALEKEKEERKKVFKTGLYRPTDSFSAPLLPPVLASKARTKEQTAVKSSSSQPPTSRVTRSTRLKSLQPQKEPEAVPAVRKVEPTGGRTTRSRAAAVPPPLVTRAKASAAPVARVLPTRAAKGPTTAALKTRTKTAVTFKEQPLPPEESREPEAEARPPTTMCVVQEEEERMEEDVTARPLPVEAPPSFAPEDFVFRAPVGLSDFKIEPLTPRSADSFLRPGSSSNLPPVPAFDFESQVEESIVPPPDLPLPHTSPPSDLPLPHTSPPPDLTHTSPPPNLTHTSPPPDLPLPHTSPPPDLTHTSPPPDLTHSSPPPDLPHTSPPPDLPLPHTSPPPAPLSPQEPEHTVLYFRRQMELETEKLSGLSRLWETRVEEEAVPEEMRDRMRTAVGQARLLMKERFAQFSGLVDDCELQRGDRVTTGSDLQGFWDMVYYQVSLRSTTRPVSGLLPGQSQVYYRVSLRSTTGSVSGLLPGQSQVYYRVSLRSTTRSVSGLLPGQSQVYYQVSLRSTTGSVSGLLPGQSQVYYQVSLRSTTGSVSGLLPGQSQVYYRVSLRSTTRSVSGLLPGQSQVYYQVEDVDKKFAALKEAESRDWVEEQKPAKPPTATAPKPAGGGAAGKSRLAAAKAAMKAKKQAAEASQAAGSEGGDGVSLPREAPPRDPETMVFQGGFFQVESPARLPGSIRRSVRLSAAVLPQSSPHVSLTTCTTPARTTTPVRTTTTTPARTTTTPARAGTTPARSTRATTPAKVNTTTPAAANNTTPARANNHTTSARANNHTTPARANTTTTPARANNHTTPARANTTTTTTPTPARVTRRSQFTSGPPPSILLPASSSPEEQSQEERPEASDVASIVASAPVSPADQTPVAPGAHSLSFSLSPCLGHGTPARPDTPDNYLIELIGDAGGDVEPGVLCCQLPSRTAEPSHKDA